MEGSAAPAAATETKTPGKIASAGKPQGGSPTFITPAPEGESQEGQAGAAPEGTGAAGTTGTPGPPGPVGTQDPVGPTPTAAQAQAVDPTTTMNDEQVKKFLEEKGIKSLEDFKAIWEKATAPAPKEPTAEEKAAAEKALDERMLKHYLDKGGKVEDYVALKALASADLKDLSISEIKRDMKANGFDDSEIDLVLKERYYQLNPDELPRLKTTVKDEETGEDKEVLESDADYNKRKELLKKKVGYGSKRLESHASPIKKQAEEILAGLREAIKTEELLTAEEAKFSSKVDEFATKIPRKVTFDLGKINEEDIPPIQFDVSEADIADVVATLKDPAKRNQFFFNQDNGLNLTTVGELMLRNKYLESAVKTAFLDGGSRQVAEFEKTFGARNPNDVGVGGSKPASQGKPGKIVKAGTPQVGTPQPAVPK